MLCIRVLHMRVEYRNTYEYMHTSIWQTLVTCVSIRAFFGSFASSPTKDDTEATTNEMGKRICCDDADSFKRETCFLFIKSGNDF